MSTTRELDRIYEEIRHFAKQALSFIADDQPNQTTTVKIMHQEPHAPTNFGTKIASQNLHITCVRQTSMA
jgi:hypothetical protein